MIKSLLFLTLATRSNGHATRYANRDLSALSVGSPGPMATGNLGAGTANTCNLATNVPTAGYTPGQQYTVTSTGSTERVVSVKGGQAAGTNTGINGPTTIQWTAPTTGAASFHTICATG